MGRGCIATAPHSASGRLNWNLFLTELVAGITHGSVYALIALGYSMVYGILKLLNFAHGDIYMVGAFIGFGVITVFGGPTSLASTILSSSSPCSSARCWAGDCSA